MNLLLVEDDEPLGDGIKVVLSRRGLDVEWVRDGITAIRVLQEQQYDLVVLDLNIPWLSGLEIIARLRAEGNQVPVLVVTARSQVVDRVEALDRGADDYLVKPFDIDELCARIRAIHRRSNPQEATRLCHEDLMLDPAARVVTVKDRPVSLSTKEFDILHRLMENRGRVLSRSKLGESLYSLDDDVESNTIEVHIHHLRKKLGTNPIKTVRGVGYVIEKTG